MALQIILQYRYINNQSVPDRPETSMKWVTRERPKMDRLACPWLIRRFIDPDAEICYVPAARVPAVATDEGAIPFDVPGVELSHSGPPMQFRCFSREVSPALPLYDALYTWCRSLSAERHRWYPQTVFSETGR